MKYKLGAARWRSREREGLRDSWGGEDSSGSNWVKEPSNKTEERREV